MKNTILSIIKQSGSIHLNSLYFQLRTEHNYPNTKRHLRSTIEDMVCNEGALIGSSDKGYFICDNREQLNEALRRIYSQARKMFVRYNALRKGFEKKQTMNFKQAQLF
jgi:hypothetical protein